MLVSKSINIMHVGFFFYFKLFSYWLASRILFKDKERKWEEIENKLQAERDSLLLRSSNKVLTTQTNKKRLHNNIC